MASSSELTDQQRAQWSAAASGWERWGGWFERQSGDLSGWMCDAAGVGPGSRVLDLACGPGPIAVLASQRVRPDGHVVATDLSPDMVAITVRSKLRLGLDNLEVVEMDMQALTLPDGSFDAATCRFGLMFCPDPVLGAAEALRVLRQGGRYAVAVWDVPPRNPFFTAWTGALGEFMPMPAPDPTAPGIFRLAPPGELERVLRTAGFTDIVVESRPIEMTYASLDEYWTIQAELAAPLRTAMATLAAADIARLKARVFESLQPYMRGDAVHLAAVPLCASASKP
jgi:SAM-dependent methyltransferase